MSKQFANRKLINQLVNLKPRPKRLYPNSRPKANEARQVSASIPATRRRGEEGGVVPCSHRWRFNDRERDEVEIEGAPSGSLSERERARDAQTREGECETERGRPDPAKTAALPARFPVASLPHRCGHRPRERGRATLASLVSGGHRSRKE